MAQEAMTYLLINGNEGEDFERGKAMTSKPRQEEVKAAAWLEQARGSANVKVSAGSDSVGRNCDYTLNLAKLLADYARESNLALLRELAEKMCQRCRAMIAELTEEE